MEDYKKKYEDALERAKEWSKNPTTWSSDDICQKIFPELAESKDERIRCCIGMILTDVSEQRFDDYKTTLKDCISWLEKQGEKKVDSKLSALLHKVVCHFINDPNVHYSERDEVSKKIIPYVEQLEKQGEQKPIEENKGNIGKISHNWSEKDEKMRNNLINLLVRLSANTRTDSTSVNYSYPCEIEWLKSLKPQSHWKPTKAQMIMLKSDISTFMKGYEKDVLQSLYDDLKKL